MHCDTGYQSDASACTPAPASTRRIPQPRYTGRRIPYTVTVHTLHAAARTRPANRISIDLIRAFDNYTLGVAIGPPAQPRAQPPDPCSSAVASSNPLATRYSAARTPSSAAHYYARPLRAHGVYFHWTDEYRAHARPEGAIANPNPYPPMSYIILPAPTSEGKRRNDPGHKNASKITHLIIIGNHTLFPRAAQPPRLTARVQRIP